ncbi:MAG: hypothetical protein AUJ92_00755 [Armatimonadetes bacterium CG2_30_59_28]|nr:type II toxin-antitoxin system ParD family antitoxin [Armatimonadota bacterium]OIO98798.1 MAG: hypothetical protein AUJ92_00755 [Armatimonadetes bacterium CG2_30_59_28]PIU60616.1 MAG: type II toxin-antitoxin system ParD family antitoxin [Armatimonadetes bacterium CG07_land_8_20_14_0_80_59_28]PIX44773.1 MAG: type II toxin-antitoxin system ParD family antitoxin [Armatimonadetes bacterium CG_4_8_14_3_um_filter_58_9]PIY38105.1 MAG: type II toxin-antitoxin system ParD family antitoxin [Armatimona
MATLIISIPDSQKDFVERQINGGQCATPSDYVEELIRLDERRKAREKLEALLLEGLDSGPVEEVTPEYWESKRAEIVRRYGVGSTER